MGIVLPQFVTMPITETEHPPSAASARTKPAEFVTGLIIQVPEYIANGDTVKIHTTEKRFMGKAE